MTEKTALTSSIKVITKEEFSAKSWNRFSNYKYTSKHMLAPLAVTEFPAAALSLPISFVKNETGYLPVALLAFNENTNLFVSEEGGWLGSYIPAIFRAYPFHLLPDQEGTPTLCIDEASGLVVDGQDGAEKFFHENGDPAAAITAVLNFLDTLTQHKAQTDKICKVMDSLDLFSSWDITIQHEDPDQVSGKVEGIFRINEEALNALNGKDLEKLQECGALSTAYAQLLSMQNIKLFEGLIQTRLDKPESNLGFSLGDSDTGSLDFGKFE